MFKVILLVGLGGGIGSIFRYLVSLFMGKYFPSNFPLATFWANILGCFIIGLLFGLIDKQLLVNQNLKYLFITGFCGGFTTFSTFSQEGISLFNSGNFGIAILYIGLSVMVGLLAVWFGMSVVKL